MGGYDPECEALAEHFLRDDGRVEPTDTNIEALAQAIQNAVEEWFDSSA